MEKIIKAAVTVASDLHIKAATCSVRGSTESSCPYQAARTPDQTSDRAEADFQDEDRARIDKCAITTVPGDAGHGRFSA